MTGDFPEATRQVYAAYAEHVIENYLAGFAANVILMEYSENSAAELLKQHYRRNESADTDFQKAIRYNIALGRQKVTDGILPLVDTLKEAIVEARGNWSAIKWAAGQLEGGGIIEGERLEKIVDGIRKRLNNRKE
jgi:acetylornithine deacetylase/succinyl-diaminopimelate desuccinylase-like protein